MQRNYTRFHLEARYQSTKYYSLEDQVEVSIFGASDSGKTTILKQFQLLSGAVPTEEELKAHKTLLSQQIVSTFQSILRHTPAHDHALIDQQALVQADIYAHTEHLREQYSLNQLLIKHNIQRIKLQREKLNTIDAMIATDLVDNLFSQEINPGPAGDLSGKNIIHDVLQSQISPSLLSIDENQASRLQLILTREKRLNHQQYYEILELSNKFKTPRSMITIQNFHLNLFLTSLDEFNTSSSKYGSQIIHFDGFETPEVITNYQQTTLPLSHPLAKQPQIGPNGLLSRPNLTDGPGIKNYHEQLAQFSNGDPKLSNQTQAQQTAQTDDDNPDSSDDSDNSDNSDDCSYIHGNQYQRHNKLQDRSKRYIYDLDDDSIINSIHNPPQVCRDYDLTPSGRRFPGYIDPAQSLPRLDTLAPNTTDNNTNNNNNNTTTTTAHHNSVKNTTSKVLKLFPMITPNYPNTKLESSEFPLFPSQNTISGPQRYNYKKLYLYQHTIIVMLVYSQQLSLWTTRWLISLLTLHNLNLLMSDIIISTKLWAFLTRPQHYLPSLFKEERMVMRKILAKKNNIYNFYLQEYLSHVPTLYTLNHNYMLNNIPAPLRYKLSPKSSRRDYVLQQYENLKELQKLNSKRFNFFGFFSKSTPLTQKRTTGGVTDLNSGVGDDCEENSSLFTPKPQFPPLQPKNPPKSPKQSQSKRPKYTTLLRRHIQKAISPIFTISPPDVTYSNSTFRLFSNTKPQFFSLLPQHFSIVASRTSILTFIPKLRQEALASQNNELKLWSEELDEVFCPRGEKCSHPHHQLLHQQNLYNQKKLIVNNYTMGKHFKGDLSQLETNHNNNVQISKLPPTDMDSTQQQFGYKFYQGHDGILHQWSKDLMLFPTTSQRKISDRFKHLKAVKGSINPILASHWHNFWKNGEFIGPRGDQYGVSRTDALTETGDLLQSPENPFDDRVDELSTTSQHGRDLELLVDAMGYYNTHPTNDIFVVDDEYSEILYSYYKNHNQLSYIPPSLPLSNTPPLSSFGHNKWKQELDWNQFPSIRQRDVPMIDLLSNPSSFLSSYYTGFPTSSSDIDSDIETDLGIDEHASNDENDGNDLMDPVRDRFNQIIEKKARRRDRAILSHSIPAMLESVRIIGRINNINILDRLFSNYYQTFIQQIDHINTRPYYDSDSDDEFAPTIQGMEVIGYEDVRSIIPPSPLKWNVFGDKSKHQRRKKFRAHLRNKLFPRKQPHIPNIATKLYPLAHSLTFTPFIRPHQPPSFRSTSNTIPNTPNDPITKPTPFTTSSTLTPSRFKLPLSTINSPQQLAIWGLSQLRKAQQHFLPNNGGVIYSPISTVSSSTPVSFLNSGLIQHGFVPLLENWWYYREKYGVSLESMPKMSDFYYFLQKLQRNLGTKFADSLQKTHHLYKFQSPYSPHHPSTIITNMASKHDQVLSGLYPDPGDNNPIISTDQPEGETYQTPRKATTPNKTRRFSQKSSKSKRQKKNQPHVSPKLHQISRIQAKFPWDMSTITSEMVLSYQKVVPLQLWNAYIVSAFPWWYTQSLQDMLVNNYNDQFRKEFIMYSKGDGDWSKSSRAIRDHERNTVPTGLTDDQEEYIEEWVNRKKRFTIVKNSFSSVFSPQSYHNLAHGSNVFKSSQNVNPHGNVFPSQLRSLFSSGYFLSAAKAVQWRRKSNPLWGTSAKERELQDSNCPDESQIKKVYFNSTGNCLYSQSDNHLDSDFDDYQDVTQAEHDSDEDSSDGDDDRGDNDNDDDDDDDQFILTHQQDFSRHITELMTKPRPNNCQKSHKFVPQFFSKKNSNFLNKFITKAFQFNYRQYAVHPDDRVLLTHVLNSQNDESLPDALPDQLKLVDFSDDTDFPHDYQDFTFLEEVLNSVNHINRSVSQYQDDLGESKGTPNLEEILQSNHQIAQKIRARKNKKVENIQAELNQSSFVGKEWNSHDSTKLLRHFVNLLRTGFNNQSKNIHVNDKTQQFGLCHDESDQINQFFSHSSPICTCPQRIEFAKHMYSLESIQYKTTHSLLSDFNPPTSSHFDPTIHTFAPPQSQQLPFSPIYSTPNTSSSLSSMTLQVIDSYQRGTAAIKASSPHLNATTQHASTFFETNNANRFLIYGFRSPQQFAVELDQSAADKAVQPSIVSFPNQPPTLFGQLWNQYRLEESQCPEPVCFLSNQDTSMQHRISKPGSKRGKQHSQKKLTKKKHTSKPKRTDQNPNVEQFWDIDTPKSGQIDINSNGGSGPIQFPNSSSILKKYKHKNYHNHSMSSIRARLSAFFSHRSSQNVSPAATNLGQVIIANQLGLYSTELMGKSLSDDVSFVQSTYHSESNCPMCDRPYPTHTQNEMLSIIYSILVQKTIKTHQTQLKELYNQLIVSYLHDSLDYRDELQNMASMSLLMNDSESTFSIQQVVNPDPNHETTPLSNLNRQDPNLLIDINAVKGDFLLLHQFKNLIENQNQQHDETMLKNDLNSSELTLNLGNANIHNIDGSINLHLHNSHISSIDQNTSMKNNNTNVNVGDTNPLSEDESLFKILFATVAQFEVHSQPHQDARNKSPKPTKFNTLLPSSLLAKILIESAFLHHLYSTQEYKFSPLLGLESKPVISQAQQKIQLAKKLHQSSSFFEQDSHSFNRAAITIRNALYLDKLQTAEDTSPQAKPSKQPPLPVKSIGRFGSTMDSFFGIDDDDDDDDDDDGDDDFFLDSDEDQERDEDDEDEQMTQNITSPQNPNLNKLDHFFSLKSSHLNLMMDNLDQTHTILVDFLAQVFPFSASQIEIVIEYFYKMVNDKSVQNDQPVDSIQHKFVRFLCQIIYSTSLYPVNDETNFIQTLFEQKNNPDNQVEAIQAQFLQKYASWKESIINDNSDSPNSKIGLHLDQFDEICVDNSPKSPQKKKNSTFKSENSPHNLLHQACQSILKTFSENATLADTIPDPAPPPGEIPLRPGLEIEIESTTAQNSPPSQPTAMFPNLNSAQTNSTMDNMINNQHYHHNPITYIKHNSSLSTLLLLPLFTSYLSTQSQYTRFHMERTGFYLHSPEYLETFTQQDPTSTTLDHFTSEMEKLDIPTMIATAETQRANERRSIDLESNSSWSPHFRQNFGYGQFSSDDDDDESLSGRDPRLFYPGENPDNYPDHATLQVPPKPVRSSHIKKHLRNINPQEAEYPVELTNCPLGHRIPLQVSFVADLLTGQNKQISDSMSGYEQSNSLPDDTSLTKRIRGLPTQLQTEGVISITSTIMPNQRILVRNGVIPSPKLVRKGKMMVVDRLLYKLSTQMSIPISMLDRFFKFNRSKPPKVDPPSDEELKEEIPPPTPPLPSRMHNSDLDNDIFELSVQSKQVFLDTDDPVIVEDHLDEDGEDAQPQFESFERSEQLQCEKIIEGDDNSDDDDDDDDDPFQTYADLPVIDEILASIGNPNDCNDDDSYHDFVNQNIHPITCDFSLLPTPSPLEYKQQTAVPTPSLRQLITKKSTMKQLFLLYKYCLSVYIKKQSKLSQSLHNNPQSLEDHDSEIDSSPDELDTFVRNLTTFSENQKQRTKRFLFQSFGGRSHPQQDLSAYSIGLPTFQQFALFGYSHLTHETHSPYIAHPAMQLLSHSTLQQKLITGPGSSIMTSPDAIVYQPSGQNAPTQALPLAVAINDLNDDADGTKCNDESDQGIEPHTRSHVDHSDADSDDSDNADARLIELTAAHHPTSPHTPLSVVHILKQSGYNVHWNTSTYTPILAPTNHAAFHHVMTTPSQSVDALSFELSNYLLQLWNDDAVRSIYHRSSALPEFNPNLNYFMTNISLFNERAQLLRSSDWVMVNRSTSTVHTETVQFRNLLTTQDLTLMQLTVFDPYIYTNPNWENNNDKKSTFFQRHGPSQLNRAIHEQQKSKDLSSPSSYYTPQHPAPETYETAQLRTYYDWYQNNIANPKSSTSPAHDTFFSPFISSLSHDYQESLRNQDSDSSLLYDGFGRGGSKMRKRYDDEFNSSQIFYGMQPPRGPFEDFTAHDRLNLYGVSFNHKQNQLPPIPVEKCDFDQDGKLVVDFIHQIESSESDSSPDSNDSESPEYSTSEDRPHMKSRMGNKRLIAHRQTQNVASKYDIFSPKDSKNHNNDSSDDEFYEPELYDGDQPVNLMSSISKLFTGFFNAIFRLNSKQEANSDGYSGDYSDDNDGVVFNTPSEQFSPLRVTKKPHSKKFNQMLKQTIKCPYCGDFLTKPDIHMENISPKLVHSGLDNDIYGNNTQKSNPKVQTCLCHFVIPLFSPLFYSESFTKEIALESTVPVHTEPQNLPKTPNYTPRFTRPHPIRNIISHSPHKRGRNTVNISNTGARLLNYLSTSPVLFPFADSLKLEIGEVTKGPDYKLLDPNAPIEEHEPFPYGVLMRPVDQEYFWDLEMKKKQQMLRIERELYTEEQEKQSSFFPNSPGSAKTTFLHLGRTNENFDTGSIGRKNLSESDRYRRKLRQQRNHLITNGQFNGVYGTEDVLTHGPEINTSVISLDAAQSSPNSAHGLSLLALQYQEHNKRFEELKKNPQLYLKTIQNLHQQSPQQYYPVLRAPQLKLPPISPELAALLMNHNPFISSLAWTFLRRSQLDLEKQFQTDLEIYQKQADPKSKKDKSRNVTISTQDGETNGRIMGPTSYDKYGPYPDLEKLSKIHALTYRQSRQRFKEANPAYFNELQEAKSQLLCKESAVVKQYITRDTKLSRHSDEFLEYIDDTEDHVALFKTKVQKELRLDPSSRPTSPIYMESYGLRVVQEDQDKQDRLVWLTTMERLLSPKQFRYLLWKRFFARMGDQYNPHIHHPLSQPDFRLDSFGYIPHIFRHKEAQAEEQAEREFELEWNQTELADKEERIRSGSSQIEHCDNESLASRKELSPTMSGGDNSGSSGSKNPDYQKYLDLIALKTHAIYDYHERLKQREKIRIIDTDLRLHYYSHTLDQVPTLYKPYRYSKLAIDPEHDPNNYKYYSGFLKHPDKQLIKANKQNQELYDNEHFADFFDKSPRFQQFLTLNYQQDPRLPSVRNKSRRVSKWTGHSSSDTSDFDLTLGGRNRHQNIFDQSSTSNSDIDISPPLVQDYRRRRALRVYSRIKREQALIIAETEKEEKAEQLAFEAKKKAAMKAAEGPKVAKWWQKLPFLKKHQEDDQNENSVSRSKVIKVIPASGTGPDDLDIVYIDVEEERKLQDTLNPTRYILSSSDDESDSQDSPPPVISLETPFDPLTAQLPYSPELDEELIKSKQMLTALSFRSPEEREQYYYYLDKFRRRRHKWQRYNYYRYITSRRNVTVPPRISYIFNDLPGRRHLRPIWVDHIKKANAQIYVINTSSFDEPLFEDNSKNKLSEEFQCFYDYLSILFLSTYQKMPQNSLQVDFHRSLLRARGTGRATILQNSYMEQMMARYEFKNDPTLPKPEFHLDALFPIPVFIIFNKLDLLFEKVLIQQRQFSLFFPEYQGPNNPYFVAIWLLHRFIALVQQVQDHFCYNIVQMYKAELIHVKNQYLIELDQFKTTFRRQELLRRHRKITLRNQKLENECKSKSLRHTASKSTHSTKAKSDGSVQSGNSHSSDSGSDNDTRNSRLLSDDKRPASPADSSDSDSDVNTRQSLAINRQVNGSVSYGPIDQIPRIASHDGVVDETEADGRIDPMGTNGQDDSVTDESDDASNRLKIQQQQPQPQQQPPQGAPHQQPRLQLTYEIYQGDDVHRNNNGPTTKRENTHNNGTRLELHSNAHYHKNNKTIDSTSNKGHLSDSPNSSHNPQENDSNLSKDNSYQVQHYVKPPSVSPPSPPSPPPKRSIKKKKKVPLQHHPDDVDPPGAVPPPPKRIDLTYLEHIRTKSPAPRDIYEQSFYITYQLLKREIHEKIKFVENGHLQQMFNEKLNFVPMYCNALDTTHIKNIITALRTYYTNVEHLEIIKKIKFNSIKAQDDDKKDAMRKQQVIDYKDKIISLQREAFRNIQYQHYRENQLKKRLEQNRREKEQEAIRVEQHRLEEQFRHQQQMLMEHGGGGRGGSDYLNQAGQFRGQMNQGLDPYEDALRQTNFMEWLNLRMQKQQQLAFHNNQNGGNINNQFDHQNRTNPQQHLMNQFVPPQQQQQQQQQQHQIESQPAQQRETVMYEQARRNLEFQENCRLRQEQFRQTWLNRQQELGLKHRDEIQQLVERQQHEVYVNQHQFQRFQYQFQELQRLKNDQNGQFMIHDEFNDPDDLHIEEPLNPGQLHHFHNQQHQDILNHHEHEMALLESEYQQQFAVFSQQLQNEADEYVAKYSPTQYRLGNEQYVGEQMRVGQQHDPQQEQGQFHEQERQYSQYQKQFAQHQKAQPQFDGRGYQQQQQQQEQLYHQQGRTLQQNQQSEVQRLQQQYQIQQQQSQNNPNFLQHLPRTVQPQYPHYSEIHDEFETVQHHHQQQQQQQQYHRHTSYPPARSHEDHHLTQQPIQNGTDSYGFEYNPELVKTDSEVGRDLFDSGEYEQLQAQHQQQHQQQQPNYHGGQRFTFGQENETQFKFEQQQQQQQQQQQLQQAQYQTQQTHNRYNQQPVVTSDYQIMNQNRQSRQHNPYGNIPTNQPHNPNYPPQNRPININLPRHGFGQHANNNYQQPNQTTAALFRPVVTNQVGNRNGMFRSKQPIRDDSSEGNFDEGDSSSQDDQYAHLGNDFIFDHRALTQQQHQLIQQQQQLRQLELQQQKSLQQFNQNQSPSNGHRQ